MKPLNCLLAGAVFALAVDINAADEKPLKSQKEKSSYGVGLNVGRSFKSELIELDVDTFVRGFRDGLSGSKIALTEAELEETMAIMRAEVQKKSEERVSNLRKAGEDFLAKNKEDKKIKVEESGLQYSVLQEGTGAMPKATDTVKVHYRGTLVDGTEFDSSYKRNMPATFPVNGVIKGWTEVLQKMKVGSKWKVFIPSDLAYGDQGQPPAIPPSSVLVFEIELLGIEKG